MSGFRFSQDRNGAPTHSTLAQAQATAGRYPPPGAKPGDPGGSGCSTVGNYGMAMDPRCCGGAKWCNWSTLPGPLLQLAGGAADTIEVVSPISSFFDIHAATFRVAQQGDITLNARALLKFVKFNTQNLEDYDFGETTNGEGVLIDAAYQFDLPTPVRWMAGTSGNNQVLTLGIENISAMAVNVYTVLYGNPCSVCPA